jgi:hypothetical protein
MTVHKVLIIANIFILNEKNIIKTPKLGNIWRFFLFFNPIYGIVLLVKVGFLSTSDLFYGGT